jgi:hypothetical protein
MINSCKTCAKASKAVNLKTKKILDYDQVLGLFSSLRKEVPEYDQKDVKWVAGKLDQKDHKDAYMGVQLKSGAEYAVEEQEARTAEQFQAIQAKGGEKDSDQEEEDEEEIQAKKQKKKKGGRIVLDDESE